jgi:hypothetical protein
VCRARILRHVILDLGDQAPGRNPLYARHCDPTGNRIGQLLMLVAQLFQTGVESLDLNFEEMKLPGGYPAGKR